jgi:predicted Zn-dependent protease
MQVKLAQAMFGTEDGALLDEVIVLLKKAVSIDPGNAIAFGLLGNALARKGDMPRAELATAQARFEEGNIKEAQIFAKRALTKLTRGSPEWLRAEDIINYKQPTP